MSAYETTIDPLEKLIAITEHQAEQIIDLKGRVSDVAGITEKYGKEHTDLLKKIAKSLK